jgi:5'-3' exonuclease
MRRLAVLIEIKMRKGFFGEDLQVDFSSAEEPGEGEHKILAHIRKIVAECRKSGKETPRIAVHGLDADLIFLMMSSECPNIYLMREMEEIDRKQRGNKQIAFVNMDRFTHYVLKSIEPPPDSTPIDCIRDWIAICYFLGNDFLPAFPSLSVKNHALDALVNCYNLTKRRLVVRDGKMWSLDTVTLTNLAQVLAVDEVASIARYPRARPNQRPWSYNSFEQEWEAINKVREPVRDTIMVGVGGESQWKYRYYSRFFKTDSMRDVHKMCHEYHKGLVWVINYYLGKCPSWSWFYPGEYAPFLSDFAKTDLESSEIEFELGEPTTPQQQLLLCLPVTSSWLIPKQYRSLVEEGGVLNDLYPTECEDELLWKSNLWQGIPHLPAFDPERVLREATRAEAHQSTSSSSSSSSSSSKKKRTSVDD